MEDGDLFDKVEEDFSRPDAASNGSLAETENLSDLAENVTSKKGKKRGADKPGFRKAPGAPKRFKSPYILFSIDRMEKYRKENGNTAKVTSISKMISDEWKALPPSDRKKWQERARLDKERYHAEKVLYTGPWQVPLKRSKKDPNAPKRPMSAFLFYCQGMRQKLKAENPELRNTEISRILGDMWKQAPEEERRPHIEREKEEREVYNKEIAVWRKHREEEEKAVLKHRQEVTQQWIKSGYKGTSPGFVPGSFPPHPRTTSLIQQADGTFVVAQVPTAVAPIVPPGTNMTFLIPFMSLPTSNTTSTAIGVQQSGPNPVAQQPMIPLVEQAPQPVQWTVPQPTQENTISQQVHIPQGQLQQHQPLPASVAQQSHQEHYTMQMLQHHQPFCQPQSHPDLQHEHSPQCNSSPQAPPPPVDGVYHADCTQYLSSAEEHLRHKSPTPPAIIPEDITLALHPYVADDSQHHQNNNISPLFQHHAHLYDIAPPSHAQQMNHNHTHLSTITTTHDHLVDFPRPPAA